MKRFILIAAPLLILVIVACNNADNSKSENDIDAARNFIRASLDGDFDKAEKFILNDTINMQDWHSVVRSLKKNLSLEDKKKYREASIRIHETRPVNDSTSIVVYSNSFKNKQDSLKVVRVENQWVVDFKYIFKHRIDSLAK